MHRVVAVGIDERINIFSTIGIEVFKIAIEEFERLVSKLSEERVAIIYVDEYIMEHYKYKVKGVKMGELPAVIAIALGESTQSGREYIKTLAKRAIGMELV